MKITQMDKSMASIIIKKGKFAIVEKDNVTEMTTNIMTKDTAHIFTFIVKNTSDNKMVKFHKAISEKIAECRNNNEVVNPFA
jgi:hypothetical protein